MNSPQISGALLAQFAFLATRHCNVVFLGYSHGVCTPREEDCTGYTLLDFIFRSSFLWVTLKVASKVPNHHFLLFIFQTHKLTIQLNLALNFGSSCPQHPSIRSQACTSTPGLPFIFWPKEALQHHPKLKQMCPDSQIQGFLPNMAGWLRPQLLCPETQLTTDQKHFNFLPAMNRHNWFPVIVP